MLARKKILCRPPRRHNTGRFDPSSRLIRFTPLGYTVSRTRTDENIAAASRRSRIIIMTRHRRRVAVCARTSGRLLNRPRSSIRLRRARDYIIVRKRRSKANVFSGETIISYSTYVVITKGFCLRYICRERFEKLSRARAFWRAARILSRGRFSFFLLYFFVFLFSFPLRPPCHKI